jgi:hydroxyethylthiazole kinase
MECFSLLEKVRTHKPLVHHITNWVTIYDCAQIVKSLGASPVMAHAHNEASDMASLASSLVFNIGTLTEDIITSMIIAGKKANEKGTPAILDVCGAGATAYRDEMCMKIISEVYISVIKGNSSEICRIAGLDVMTKGVDAGDIEGGLEKLCAVARTLALAKKCTVVITGKEDILSDGKRTFIVSNGTSLMTNVVGTGCMASSVIGSFIAIESDYVHAAAAGLCCYEIAAEKAAKDSSGLMQFKNKIFDSVFNLSKDDVEKNMKIRQV